MLRILDKPAGLTTHTSLSMEERTLLAIDPVDSFLGHLSMRSGRSLFPGHRLDRGTTGVLLATDTAEEAAELAKAFEARDVEKTYYFLTDRNFAASGEAPPTGGHPLRVQSFIDRRQAGLSTGDLSGSRASNFFSRPANAEYPVNAITDFEFVEAHDEYSLWRARPLTGRPHQIRLHAETLGLSILGDVEHGGTSFPALCLHAAEIRLNFQGEVVNASSPVPRWFKNLPLLMNRSGLRLVNWIAAVERRERLDRSLTTVGIETSETRRLIHADGDDLRMDRLGPVTQLHWYGADFDATDRDAIDELIRTLDLKDWYIQTRANRGKNPNETEITLAREDLPVRWPAREENLRFTFRRDTGLSTGLFLDQRANRRWVLRNSRNARVLNLFSYTGGFSVAAALGGAALVASVDLSKNFLNWSKENFLANDIRVPDATKGAAVAAGRPDDPRYEFRAMEARDFLKWAKKKELTYDLVICDPPSFARTDNGVFRIESELESLWASCLDVTAPGGRILFSLNYEPLTEADVFARAEDFLRGQKRTITLRRSPSPDLDFEFPREARSMKSFIFEIA